MHRRAGVRRTKRGDYEVRLPAGERELLEALPGELAAILASDDPSVRRLFPPAYPDDPERDAEYHRLMREDLVAEHRTALEVLARTAGRGRLEEEEMTAWLAALNDLRLVLGTRLDVTEDIGLDDVDQDDPAAPAYQLYRYLTWLEAEVVEALSEGLPDPSGADEW